MRKNVTVNHHRGSEVDKQMSTTPANLWHVAQASHKLSTAWDEPPLGGKQEVQMMYAGNKQSITYFLNECSYMTPGLIKWTVHWHTQEKHFRGSHGRCTLYRGISFLLCPRCLTEVKGLRRGTECAFPPQLITFDAVT